MGKLAENDIVLENCRIEKTIGQGAFGEVYLATNTGVNSKRAIKVLLHDEVGLGSSDYASFRNRFRQEAKLIAWFDCTHLIRVYDFREVDNTLYLVMEYAAGGSLREKMDRAKEKGHNFSAEETARIGLDIAEGLAALHAKDVIHRDVKPSNILFNADGNAKVADLGLAQVPGGPSLRSELSVPPPHPGTPAYMSPEHANSNIYLSPPSDIYALGLILFEMMTGRNYKMLEPGKRLRDIQPEAPAWLDDLLARMLDENPRKRPWNGEKAAIELRKGLAEEVAKKKKTDDVSNIEGPNNSGRLEKEILLYVEQGMAAIKAKDWEAARRAVKALEKLGDEGKTAGERLEIQIPDIKPSTNGKFIKQYWWVGLIGFGIIIYALSQTIWLSQNGKTVVIPATLTQKLPEQQILPSATTKPIEITPTADSEKKFAYSNVTMCFPQLGSESDWRNANTTSFKETATKLGIHLIFSDAQQSQENQISAMRSCIAQKVDIIALPPIVENGWDAVLQEAKNAAIPVIVIDRSIVADPSLYTTHIGSNMDLEGQKAAIEMNKLLPNGGKIVELRGTDGSGAAVGRAEGFREAHQQNIKIIDTQVGNFTRADGKIAMTAMLKKNGKTINGLFSHNDDMTMGAIEALKAAGYKPGDIKIVSIDGTREAFQAMIDGWITVDVECNPMLGPQTMEIAQKILNGEQVDHEIFANESIFYPDQAAGLISTRKY
jgi:simple sugar transport system substrate-binding protein